jgi:hypothetical protein
MEYVVNFFATPVTDYGKLFKLQAMQQSCECYGSNKRKRK